MAKLSKQQAKHHAQACEILKQDRLSYDDRVFVLENWQESASHINSTAGAFFTPSGLARDLAIETTGRTIVDLCAGIGALAFAAWDHSGQTADITCVEVNPDYVAVGRKVLPEATWICASVFDYKPGRVVDCVISNPPFGRVPSGRGGESPRYTGGDFEYRVIDLAKDMARDGVFILPQQACPWKYSGHSHYETVANEKYEKFSAQTGIQLSMNCGIDCAAYAGDWRGVAPRVEIALGFEREG